MQQKLKTEKNRRVYKRVQHYSGAQKKFRIFNLVFAIALSLACLVWGIYRLAIMGFSDPELRWLSSLGIGALSIFPLLLERVFKFNLSNFIWVMYLAFLLFAGFIGSGLGLYPKLSFIHYDKITHGIFGYIACVGGLLLVCKVGNINLSNTFFVAIVCFCLSMACGAMWEIYEFICDRLLGATAQGQRVYLNYAIVQDTMWDIICNFFGAVGFVLQYVLYKTTGKNLLIGSMIKDFTKK